MEGLKYIMEIDDQEQHTYSDYFPVYNGDFWNIFVGTKIENPDEITTSGDTTYTPIYFGAYQSNHLKNCNYVTATTKNDMGVMDNNINTLFNVASAWGLEYSGSNNDRRHGANFCFIGE